MCDGLELRDSHTAFCVDFMNHVPYSSPFHICSIQLFSHLEGTFIAKRLFCRDLADILSGFSGNTRNLSMCL